MRYLILLILLFSFENYFASITPFKGHTKKVNTTAFSPDGELLATVSDDNTIRIWNVISGKRVKTLKGHTDDVLCIEFSPNGRELLSGSKDTQIKLWNLSSTKEIRTYKLHTAAVNTIKFDKSGEYFISGSADNTIRFWKINKRKSISVLTKHNAAINDLAFSPDGKYFASASNDNTIKLWSRNSRKLVNTYKGHSREVNAICFSNNSKIIYSASADKTIKLWKISSNKAIKTINAHDNPVNSIAISQDNQFLFSSSDDSQLKTWDLDSYENIYTYTDPNFNAIKSIKLSPNEKILAITNTSKIPQLVTVQTEKSSIDNSLSNIWVVIVGVSQYKYRENSLYSVNDALRVYGFYKSPEGGALNDNQIKVLTNDEASSINIIRAMNETFAKADKNDIIIFYYSGHGEKDGLSPYNSSENSSNLNYETLVNSMESSAAEHKICIIDACYSGNLALIIDETNSNILESTKEKEIAFLLSSTKNEQALGYRNLKQGVFSFFFIEGLKGSADGNTDNLITIYELFKYINHQVKAYTNHNQNPILTGNYNENWKIGSVLSD